MMGPCAADRLPEDLYGRPGDVDFVLCNNDMDVYDRPRHILRHHQSRITPPAFGDGLTAGAQIGNEVRAQPKRACTPSDHDGPRSFGGSSPLRHTEEGGTGTSSSRKNRVWNDLSARRRTRPYGGAANWAPGTSSAAYGIMSTSP